MYIYKLTKYPKSYIEHPCLMKIARQLIYASYKQISKSKKQLFNILCKNTTIPKKKDFTGVNISKKRMIQYS